jgi:hypothetical protein
MDSSAANVIVEPSSGPLLAEINLAPVPIQVDMNKLIGVLFTRLGAIDQRLANMDLRLQALEQTVGSAQ